VSFQVEDFQPGDLTVTPVLEGFMIARMLAPLGIGMPWWTFIKIVADEAEAILQASAIASLEHRHVWFQEAPGKFRTVPGR